MMRWVRPPEDPALRDRVAKAEATVRTLAAEGRPSSEHFDPLWRRIKRIKRTFVDAQRDRCGYCDLALSGWGDVEHFRPKAALTRLEPGADGVDPAPEVLVSDRGWWWLAYAWSNWLVACERCNQRWKRGLFPVVGGHDGPPCPDDPLQEPLLLHPFDGPDPEAHLGFDRNGAIRPQNASPYALETIRTYGLHRPDLVEKRHMVCDSAHRALTDLDDPHARVRRRALDLLGRQGTASTAFAGVTRCIWREATEIPWRSAFQPGDPWDQPRQTLLALVRAER